MDNKNYFSTLASCLQSEGISYPTLIVDEQRLDKNIQALATVAQQGKHIRIVAKSLPSLPLLEHIMERLDTHRLMCFHLPFLIHVIENLPHTDLLLGKPMPLSALDQFYTWFRATETDFNPTEQLQWLVDSESRLADYITFAEQHHVRLNINLEVDVGLHRGGFTSTDAFRRALVTLKNSEVCRFSGIMGYEAHITKIPAILGGPKRAEALSKAQYLAFVEIIEEVLGDAQQYCLNAGGSTTYPLYTKSDVCNEVATASALVKPTDFDVYTLSHHEPAAFIAAPVLKRVEEPELPMAPLLSKCMRMAGVLPQQAAFIYGGNWLADPCFPEATKRVTLYGHSSNQELYSIPAEASLVEEDYLFFRPHQSEAVFLQFGKIACYNGNRISRWWPCFSYPDSLPLGQGHAPQPAMKN